MAAQTEKWSKGLKFNEYTDDKIGFQCSKILMWNPKKIAINSTEKNVKKVKIFKENAGTRSYRRKIIRFGGLMSKGGSHEKKRAIYAVLHSSCWGGGGMGAVQRNENSLEKPFLKESHAAEHFSFIFWLQSCLRIGVDQSDFLIVYGVEFLSFEGSRNSICQLQ